MADREVLAIALDQTVTHILSDDRGLRREAAQHGVPCVSASQVVVLLKLNGLIPQAKPVLDRMRQRGYGIGNGPYQSALQAVGE
jgi:predicted nucleic acid-binding protein